MKAIEIFWIFLKLGLTSFGGPVAHLAYFRHAFVEQRNWFTESQYAHLITICQIIPGPASSQVGFAIGLLRGGWLGAICAFFGFTLPSVFLLLLFASSLSLFDSSIAQAGLHGLAILAFIVVLQAVMGMSKQLLVSPLSWCIAAAMFCVVLLSEALAFQVIALLCCAIVSSVLTASNTEHLGDANSASSHYKLPLYTTWIAGVLFVTLLLLLVGNPFNVNEYLYDHAPAYYTSGAMVFGGGHVVLPFLEHTTVAQGLVTQDVFLAGYGATQAVPGPMFSFAAYLGYMTQLNQPLLGTEQGLVLSAMGGALMATLFVFLPGFLLLSAVLPVSQKLFGYRALKNAFIGANAGVVGLLAATLYDPIFTHAIKGNIDIMIAGVGFVLLTKAKLPVLAIVVLCIVAKILALYV